MANEARQREFRFSRTFNFRDVGGYPTADGRTVRWRRLFRSDTLSPLTTDDQQQLLDLGVRTVVDLRQSHEIAEDGRVPDLDGLNYYNLAPRYPEWELTPYEEGDDPVRYLADRYRDMAEHGASRVAEAIGVLAGETAAPAVVHCRAGKDRTGVVCALTLALLGVADDDIDHDYTRSTTGNEQWVAWAQRNGYPDLVMKTYWRSHPGTMLLFLSELRERYGSVEHYLTGAGLARRQIIALRTHLLA